MIRVLIITYYWPPSGGSGVQRWLKFVKYLREFGIEPIIFTPKNAKYSLQDKNLSNDIPDQIETIRKSIIEPSYFSSILGKKKNSRATNSGFLNSKPSTTGKIARYLRANLFIPDARFLWINPSARHLVKYLQKKPVDAIISTGPPHSLHLIALKIKKKINIPWIADFRDPWVNIDYMHHLPLTKKSRQKHISLEKKVLENSDATIVVGKSMKSEYAGLSDNITIITNGYDDFASNTSAVALSSSFSITHVGLMNADRNPDKLWAAISELCKENETFAKKYEIKLIGKVAPEVKNSLKKYNLKNVTYIDYIPHNELREHQFSTQILLLAINNVPSAKSIITGKIFEYLQAKRPILAIGPVDGDLAEILHETNSGEIFGFEDKDGVKKSLIDMYQKFEQNNLIINSRNIEQYHRKSLTKELAKLIEHTIDKSKL